MNLRSALVFATLACLPLLANPRPCLAYVEDIRNTRLESVTRDTTGTLRLADGTILNLGGRTQAPAAVGLPTVIPMCRTDFKRGSSFTFRMGSGASLPRSAPKRDFFHQLHYTYRGAEGIIHDVWVTDGQAWQYQQLNGEGGLTQLPAAATDPVGILYKDQYHAFWLDADGGIQDAYYDGAWKTQKLNIDGVTAARAAAGTPSATVYKDQLHICYRDRDNNIQDVYYDGRWHIQQLNRGGLTETPASASDVASVVFAEQYHVTYLDAEGKLQDVWYDGRWNRQTLNVDGKTTAPAGQGTPATAAFNGDQFHAVYRTEGGILQDVYYASGRWQVQQLNRSGLTSGGAANSDPAVQSLGDGFNVGYQDSEGAFQVMSYSPAGGWRINRRN